MKKLISMCLAACLLAGCGSTTHDEKNKMETLTITNSVELDCTPNDMSGYSWLTGETGTYYEVTLEESVRLFAEGGTGVIYYGYVGCEWCERALPELNKIMVELNLPVYYVDASVQPDDETYDHLLTYVGDDLKKDDDGEPAFYVPYVVGVKNGQLTKSHIALVSGYSVKNPGSHDASDQMNDSQKEKLQEIYRDIFRSVAD